MSSTMPAMHEDMQQRAGQKQNKRKVCEDMRAMFCHQKKARNRQKHDKDDGAARHRYVGLLRIVRAVIHDAASVDTPCENDGPHGRPATSIHDQKPPVVLDLHQGAHDFVAVGWQQKRAILGSAACAGKGSCCGSCKALPLFGFRPFSGDLSMKTRRLQIATAILLGLSAPLVAQTDPHHPNAPAEAPLAGPLTGAMDVQCAAMMSQ